MGKICKSPDFSNVITFFQQYREADRRATCEEFVKSPKWGTPSGLDAWRRPSESDIPTLWFTGDLDPKVNSLEAQIEEIRRQFSKAWVYEIKGRSHIPLLDGYTRGGDGSPIMLLSSFFSNKYKITKENEQFVLNPFPVTINFDFPELRMWAPRCFIDFS